MSEQKQMKPFLFWFTAVSLDSLLLVLLYQWDIKGVEQAGDLAIFWLWAVTVINLIAGLFSDKTNYADQPRPAGFGGYHFITEVLFISVLVWLGFFWLPTIYLISSLLKEGSMNREPKAKKEVAQ